MPLWWPCAPSLHLGGSVGSPGLSSPVLSPPRMVSNHSSRPGLFSRQVIQQSVQRSKPVTSAPLVPVDARLSPHCRSCYWCVSMEHFQWLSFPKHCAASGRNMIKAAVGMIKTFYKYNICFVLKLQRFRHAYHFHSQAFIGPDVSISL